MRFSSVRAGIADASRTFRGRRKRSPLTTHRRGALAAVLLGVLLIGATIPSGAEPAGLDVQLAFDIPAQDIDLALKAYATITGLQILYEPAVTMGRRSMPVNGAMTPEAALSVLLAGSGLVGRRTDVDAVVVVAGAPPSVDVVDAVFLGALQAGILRGLCRDERTRPGAYRVAVQVWLTRNGTIRRTTLLGSTGEARRDAALLRALDTVVVGHVPAYAAERPLTMTINPGMPGSGAACGQ